MIGLPRRLTQRSCIFRRLSPSAHPAKRVRPSGAKRPLQIDPIAAIAKCVLTIVSTPTEYTCVVSTRIKWQKTVGF